MLIEFEKGKFQSGPADILCILKFPAGTFHVAFFEENPFPGPIKKLEECDVLRLKSKMHHTVGSPTIEGAREQLAEIRTRIIVPDSNVCDRPLPVAEAVSVWVLPNWLRNKQTIGDVLP
jgi:hypothetical protein